MDPSLQFHQLSADQRALLGLTTPTPFFLTGSDALQISSWNSLASVSLTVAGRFRPLNGEDCPFVFTHAPNSNRTIASTIQALGDGWLLNVTVFVTGAAPIIGQTFVRLQIVRGLSSSGIVLGTIAAGYVTAVQPIAWPGSGVMNSLAGQGAIRAVVGTTPAAGANISETVPTGARWRFISAQLSLTTDANVANRQIQMLWDDGANAVAEAGPLNNQPAGQTKAYKLGAYGFSPVFIIGGEAVALQPHIMLIGGFRFRTSTGGIQVGDQFTAPKMLIEEWLEGAA